MVYKIRAGGEADNGSGEKAGRGAYGQSTYIIWWDSLRVLVKVKLWGIKEGTVVDDSIFWNWLLSVFAREGGSTDFNWGPEHVLEVKSESSHPSYDYDTQGNI